MLKALHNLLKDDIIKIKTQEKSKMKETQLTTAEMEILILISSIREFESENPENELKCSVEEVIVSNELMEPDRYERVTDSLCHLGLIDDEDFLTDAGQSYIEQVKKDAENMKSDRNAVCVNNYSNVNFEKVAEWFKSIHWNEVITDTGKLLTGVNTLLSFVDTYIKAFN